MSIYLSSNPGSYTPEAANLERQIEGAQNERRTPALVGRVFLFITLGFQVYTI